MVTLQEQRLVSRPIDEVFGYTADFENIEEWDPGVASSRRVDVGPLGVGSRFELKYRFGASEIPMVYEITEYEPSVRVVLAGTSDSLDTVDTIEFESRDDGRTGIDYRAELEFHNWVRFVSPFIRPVFDKVGRDAVDGLVAALGR